MKPDKGRAMPVSLIRFMRLNQNRPTLYNSNIKTIIQRQFLYFFLNKTIDTPYLTYFGDTA